MADPTLEDLQAQIEDLRSLITTEYQPPSGPEYSYPTEDQPMSGEMWLHLAKAWGSGVISYGGAPYRIGNVDDVNNTLTVYAADDEGRESGAVLEGYAHRMTDNITISVNAVSQATDYVIGLQYDPLRPANPIELGAYKRPLDVTQGKRYIPIWEGRRDPSSVLSTVTWSTARSRIAPTTTVSRARYLPDPRHSGLMWGTLCWTYRDRKWFQLQWATEDGGEMEWVDITDPPWVTVPDGSYVWPGHGYRRGQRRIGNTGELRGRIARGSGAEFLSGGGEYSAGYTLMYLDDDKIPQREQRFITGTNNYSGNRLAVITVSPDGRVYGTPMLGSAKWMSIDGIRYSVSE